MLTMTVLEYMWCRSQGNWNQYAKLFWLMLFSSTVVSNKVGPINSTTGQTLYDYLGCYQESMNGPRLFPNEPLQPNRTGMNNDLCQQTCFSSAQYTFAGTEFGDE